MKGSRVSVGLLLCAFVGCSGANIPGLDGVGSLVNDLQNGTPDVSSLSKVDIGTALSAGADLAKTVSLSDDDVKQIAMQAAEHSDRVNRVAASGSAYAKRLSRLTVKHQKEDGLNLKYKVYLTPEVNAFAMADGNIRVYSGLMDLMPDDQELLAIIGHEIGHVKEGHRKEKMRMAYAASAARKGLASMNNTVGAVANSALIGGMVEDLVNAQFSQSEEREADDYSVAFLKRYNYSPYAAVRAMEKFAKLSEEAGRDSKASDFFSSHPAPGERAERLALALKEEGIKPGDAVVAKASPVEKSANKAEVKLAAQRTAVKSVEQPLKTASQKSNVSVAKAAVKAPKAASSAVQNQSTVPGGKTATLAKNGKAVSAATAAEVQVIDAVEPGFYVQLAAKTEKAEAQSFVGNLFKTGLPARTQEAVVSGQKYYRVLVGPFTNGLQAASVKQRIVSAEISNERPFIQKFN